MNDIIVVTPEQELETAYLHAFQKSKRVMQNLFYTTQGASSFYTYRGEDLREIKWQDEYAFFAQQAFWQKDQAMAFISLGCGNAGAESALLNQAHAAGYDMTYFGVDSSRAMLGLARENLNAMGFEKQFVLADFLTAEFRKILHAMTASFDTRIYAMLGGTFGNFEQATITQRLNQLLTSGDYVYLDVVPLYGSESQDRQLRERLAHLPQNLKLFFDNLLQRLCISPEDGELYSTETQDEALQAWRYRFFFRPNTTITLPCFLDSVSFAPGESLELLNVRLYDPAALKTFLHKAGFDFIDEYIPDVGKLNHLWQRFLFQKRG